MAIHEKCDICENLGFLTHIVTVSCIDLYLCEDCFQEYLEQEEEAEERYQLKRVDENGY